jgi:outer membrane protein OmpA-like peptidoglycan-associated protein
MKKLMILVFSTLIIMVWNMPASAQVDDPGKKVENKGEDRVNKNMDDGIDKGFDKIEDGIGNLFKKKKKKDKGAQAETQEQHDGGGQAAEPYQASETEVPQEAAPQLNWAKYDFVPGDDIIFEDIQENEENGEFPSKWDLVKGTVENAEFGGESVIMFRGGSPTIIPYLKNPDQDYLPDVFTVEFDLYLPNNSFEVFFYDRKNQKQVSGSSALKIWSKSMELRPAQSNIPEGSIAGKWSHIAIAHTNGKLKAYINETRLINIPRLEFNPTGISLHCYHAKDDNQFYVKNFRIAEGGVKYYDRFMQDGKIIANGIRFDVNKASLKPESMGVINEIFELMSKNPDIKFSVEGHTDSDGDTDFNQKLSEDRAQTVVNTLQQLGVSPDRLTSKGWGETKPITGNDSPEGKATNRRVEFVKM